MQSRHSRKLQPPSADTPFEVLPLTKVFTDEPVIMQRRRGRVVHPQPLNTTPPATIDSEKRRRTPRRQRRCVQLIRVTTQRNVHAQRQQNFEQPRVISITHFMSIQISLARPRRANIRRVAVNELIAAPLTITQPGYRIGTNNRQRRHFITAPNFKRSCIGIDANGRRRRPLSFQHSTSAQERFDINTMRRNLIYDPLRDTSAAFAAIVTHENATYRRKCRFRQRLYTTESC